MSATNTLENGRETAAELKGATRSFAPQVDMLETQDEFRVYVDLPGAVADNVEVQFEDGVLTLHACVPPRQEPDAEYLLREYSVGDYHREFRVGEGVDAAQIAAECRDGVLTLHLPKSPAARQRRIAVRGT